jgi:hypothetical protein
LYQAPLPVYTALGQAGHLAGAAGVAATGLALTGLAFTMPLRRTAWARSLARITMGAGILLMRTAPVGPVSLPVLALWTAATSVTAFRLQGTANTGKRRSRATRAGAQSPGWLHDRPSSVVPPHRCGAPCPH